MKKYPAARPYITKTEERYVLAVLRSGILSLGPKLEEFERKFAQRIGTRYAVAVSSGTAGLHLALLAAGVGEGDEVLTTPFSFIASANCILYVGARPVFVDIEPVSFNVDPRKIEDKITPKTKAILIVHIFGQAADMRPILRIVKKHRLTIIEDACESIGAFYGKRAVGTFGETAVFSFYPNKQMTTGEGGIIVTNRKSIYELSASLRNQGRAPNMQWLDHQYLGYNYRMDEMSAALGIAQLEKLDAAISERRRIAGWYAKYLAPYPELVTLPRTAPGNTHTWFVYVIQAHAPALSRDDVIAALSRKNIQTRPYLPPIHLFDFYRKKFHYSKGDFPVCEAISARSLALPFYIGLTERDVRFIASILIKILKDNYGA